jgi:hypothetical protein
MLQQASRGGRARVAEPAHPPTQAHHARAHDEPLHVVAGRVGDDPKTLLAAYAHLLAHSEAEAAEVVADAIDGRVEAVA